MVEAVRDNKVRLDPDVIDRAHAIATRLGMKPPEARRVIEAVFRSQSDAWLKNASSLVESEESTEFVGLDLEWENADRALRQ